MCYLVYFLLGINHLINVFVYMAVLVHVQVWRVHAEARGRPHLLFLRFHLPFQPRGSAHLCFCRMPVLEGELWGLLGLMLQGKCFSD